MARDEIAARRKLGAGDKSLSPPARRYEERVRDRESATGRAGGTGRFISPRGGRPAQDARHRPGQEAARQGRDLEGEWLFPTDGFVEPFAFRFRVSRLRLLASAAWRARSRFDARARGRAKAGNRAWADASALYGIPHWGKGFFHVSEEGELVVRPTREATGASRSSRSSTRSPPRHLDADGDPLPADPLHGRVEPERGLRPRDRRVRLQGTLPRRYPIKVNQQRDVVEEIVEAGRPYQLRPRSRHQARAARGHRRWTDNPEALIICNGYKDDDLHRDGAASPSQARQAGHHRRRKLSELDAIIAVARDSASPAHRHARASSTPRAPASGRSRAATLPSSASPRPRCSRPSRSCKRAGMLDCFELLHFHIGSQITDIRDDQGRDPRGEPHLRRSCARSGVPHRSTSTSAAASASTTTARRPLRRPR